MNRLIAFDMDGVLIDVSRSYRDVVRQTARLFLLPARGARLLPDPLFSLSELAVIKQAGGLNNDWDLSCHIIGRLMNLVECSDLPDDLAGWRLYNAVLPTCDVTQLAEFLQNSANPLQQICRDHAGIPNAVTTRLYAGDVGSGNIIKQIFQEIYLGPDLFFDTYADQPRTYHQPGYIHRENVIIQPAVLRKLSHDNLLAIATGRPRGEALYPLKRYNLLHFFVEILTLDDCLAAQRQAPSEPQSKSLSKPHPFMLDAIAEKRLAPGRQFMYVGDMPDDMQAAKRSRAGFIGIGCTTSAPHPALLRQRLEQAGARYMLADVNHLPNLLDQIDDHRPEPGR